MVKRISDAWLRMFIVETRSLMEKEIYEEKRQSGEVAISICEELLVWRSGGFPTGTVAEEKGAVNGDAV